MDDLDKTIEALKVQIKKEIVDNYFAERVYLEEDVKALQEEVQAYQQELAPVARLFQEFYQALGTEPAIAGAMHLLSLKEWPFYKKFLELSEKERQDLVRGYRQRGFTAWRRYRNLVVDLYDKLQEKIKSLQGKQAKIMTHLRLLNEDIDKFNTSFDFGLIAAQIEAMEGGGAVISGGLLSSEREELSTRMRFKRQKLTAEQLPPLPPLPPRGEIRTRLSEMLRQYYQR